MVVIFSFLIVYTFYLNFNGFYNSLFILSYSYYFLSPYKFVDGYVVSLFYTSISDSYSYSYYSSLF